MITRCDVRPARGKCIVANPFLRRKIWRIILRTLTLHYKVRLRWAVELANVV
jgi:hypothetical protein